MSASPFVPFYTSDFLGGTSGMTAATKGVYITLLCLMYEGESPLAQSWDTLARRCGCTNPAFKKALEALIDDGKVVIIEGRIWSEKCEKHIAQRRERSNSASSSAKKRWEKTQRKQREGDANAMQSQCERNANHNHNHNHNIDDTNVSLPIDPANDASEAVRLYNEAASRCGWPAVQKMTPARSRSLKARLADAGGLIGWQDAIDRAEQSDFLNARTQKQWTGFGFDWIIKAANFTKLMEGNYDNRTHGQTANANAADREIAFAARFARTPGEDCF